jgi:hypothetical protein
MAIVRWLISPGKSGDLRQFGPEEKISVYEVVEHPHFSYTIGDVVVRLSTGTLQEDLSLQPQGESSKQGSFLYTKMNVSRC